MRVLAVDGTRLVLPKHQSIVGEFSEHFLTPNADSARSPTTGTILYDTLNHLTPDAGIAH